MSGKTMSDWEKLMTERGLEKEAGQFSTNKEEDLARLRNTNLPQFDLLVLPYPEFGRENQRLIDFFRQHIEGGRRFCVRALPTEEGKQRGYTRKPRLNLVNFEDSKRFLEGVVKQGEEDLWKIGISDMAEQIYGGVIIAGLEGRRYVRGEISRYLDKLTAGEEQPLASFIFDRGRVGRVESKTNWLVGEDLRAKRYLWQTARDFIIRGDGFNPFIWDGYFEFVVTDSGEIKFVDYKENPAYRK